MKVLVFARYESEGPSSWYRYYSFAPLLEKEGVTLEIRPLFDEGYLQSRYKGEAPLNKLLLAYRAAKALKRRINDLKNFGDYSLIIIEGYLFPYIPPVLELALAARSGKGAPIYFEFDDALYLTPFHREKLNFSLKMADGAIVGNPWLAAWARHYNRNVHIVPTVVDADRLSPKTNWELSKPINICWVGLPYNLPMLEIAAPALRKFARETYARLHIISSRRFELKGVETVFHRWSLEEEAALLRSMDIGIMPLPDDEWSKGKCGAKLLQYLSAGLPSVASPVGVNRVIAEYGSAALLAETEEEWLEALRKIASDKSLRQTLAANGRKKVEEEYSLKAWAPKLAALYRELARR